MAGLLSLLQAINPLPIHTYFHNQTFPHRSADFGLRRFCIRFLFSLRLSYRVPADIILLESRTWDPLQEHNRGRNRLC